MSIVRNDYSKDSFQKALVLKPKRS